MEKYLKLKANLEKCYIKLSYAEYLMSSDEVKENTCKAERDALTGYLNSDSMNHENILRERIDQFQSI